MAGRHGPKPGRAGPLLELAGLGPVPTQAISWLDLGFMIGVTAVVWPMLASGRKLSRWEGGALVASYGVYLFLMWP